MTNTSTTDRYTLIFDGHCGVCQRSVAWIKGWDAHDAIECLPYQDATVSQRFPDFTDQALDDELHLVDPEGGVTRGARAVEEIFRIADGAPRLGWLFAIPGGRAAARVGYRIFARNRHRFGCGDHCSINAKVGA